MTKKQCGIIFTLLALILCTGVLAAKLNNGGLNDPTDLSQVLSSETITQNNTEVENESDTETMIYRNIGRSLYSTSISSYSWNFESSS